MTKRMKRWTLDGLGRDQLVLSEVEIPTPGPSEVLVKVAALSLNYRDKMVVESGMGLDLAFPFTPLSDLAGTVAAVGPGVTRFAEGARVISTFVPHWIDGPARGSAAAPAYPTLGGRYQGVAAEYVVLSEEVLAAAPVSLTDIQASTLPIAGLTAWFALIEEGRLAPGQTVVLQGTGGVSLFGLQIAKAAGARAIVTSGDDAKLARALALGADHGVNRLKGDWAQDVVALTGGRGADHILEVAGGDNFDRSIAAAAVRGQISVIGLLDGTELKGTVFPMLLKQLAVRGIVVGHRRALEDLVRFVDQSGLKPVIDHEYGFTDLHQALDHLDHGPFGKIVLKL
ncbi:MAG: NAD(P)-dependent alcohol dehydrogenase [Caulobacter sp.]|nr:NAD(P)-dependent alcohol dehydrogenase [Caulobacter sp.]